MNFLPKEDPEEGKERREEELKETEGEGVKNFEYRFYYYGRYCGSKRGSECEEES